MNQINFLKKFRPFLFFLFIFLIVNSGFGTSTGCCVVDNTGNYCIDDSTDSECAEDFYEGSECSQLPFVNGTELGLCDRVTCVEQDGSCTAQKYLRECVLEGAYWVDSEVSEVEECGQGCCQLFNSEGQIMNQYQVVFGAQCALDASLLGLSHTFEQGECEILDEQEGCCISNSGCFRSTDAQCDGMEWQGGELCSNQGLCNCGEFDVKKCHDNDVYYFNHCGDPNPEGPEEECALNLEMCDIETFSCKAVTCMIPVNFTTLNYDTFAFKAGEVGVEYKDPEGEIVDIEVNTLTDNYQIDLLNLGSACVQYQGPGESHLVYTCDMGYPTYFRLSQFSPRARICEWDTGIDGVWTGENDYSSCLSCSTIEQSGGPLKAIVDFLAWLADMGGWTAMDWNFWDYWVFNPGMCNKGDSCSDLGHCAYDSNSQWCVPKYAPETVEQCGVFTESKAGSPWNKPKEGCQSCGRCSIDESRTIDAWGTLLVCFLDGIANNIVDWLMDPAISAILGSLDWMEGAMGGSDEEEPTNEQAQEETGLKAKLTTLKNSFVNKLGDLAQGWKMVFSLGGLIHWDQLNDAIRYVYFGTPMDWHEEEELIEDSDSDDSDSDDSDSDEGDSDDSDSDEGDSDEGDSDDSDSDEGDSDDSNSEEGSIILDDEVTNLVSGELVTDLEDISELSNMVQFTLGDDTFYYDQEVGTVYTDTGIAAINAWVEPGTEMVTYVDSDGYSFDASIIEEPNTWGQDTSSQGSDDSDSDDSDSDDSDSDDSDSDEGDSDDSDSDDSDSDDSDSDDSDSDDSDSSYDSGSSSGGSNYEIDTSGTGDLDGDGEINAFDTDMDNDGIDDDVDLDITFTQDDGTIVYGYNNEVSNVNSDNPLIDVDPSNGYEPFLDLNTINDGDGVWEGEVSDFESSWTYTSPSDCSSCTCASGCFYGVDEHGRVYTPGILNDVPATLYNSASSISDSGVYSRYSSTGNLVMSYQTEPYTEPSPPGFNFLDWLMGLFGNN